MRRVSYAAVISVGLIAAGVLSAQPDARRGDAILNLLLFFGAPENVKPAALPAEARASLQTYLARYRKFRSLLPPPESRSSELAMLQAARVGYERRLAVVSADPRAPALAASYVQKLRPCYEWESFHHCPIDEAVFADKYLEDDPDGPFRTFLPLLAAHRWLCAAEAYGYEQKPNQAAQAYREYEDRLEVAKRSEDPLMRAAAKTLAERGRCYFER